MNKEGHFILIRELIQQEDMAVLNIYLSYTGASEYIKQLLVELQRNKQSTIIVGTQTILSLIDGTRRKKISKNIEEFQLDLIDIYRTLQLKQQNSFFSSPEGSLLRKTVFWNIKQVI